MKKKNYKTPAIGDIVPYHGKKYTCALAPRVDDCDGCALLNHNCYDLNCLDGNREDGKNVIFVEVPDEQG